MQTAVLNSEIVQISTTKIVPSPNQPRKIFAEDGILRLADSIKQYGIIQPLVVRQSGEYYELIAGERRLRAAKELNLPSVPCIISQVTEEKSAEISIIENIIRENLNIFEQASAIESLIDTYGLTQEQVAEKLSVSQSFIANKLRLLRLSNEERELILQNNLSERHARAVLRIYDHEKRMNLLNQVVSKELNVSKTEEIVNSMLNPCQKQDDQNSPREQSYSSTDSFITAINRSIEYAKKGNLNIKTRKIVGETFTEITIILPNDARQYTNEMQNNTTDMQEALKI